MQCNVKNSGERLRLLLQGNKERPYPVHIYALQDPPDEEEIWHEAKDQHGYDAWVQTFIPPKLLDAFTETSEDPHVGHQANGEVPFNSQELSRSDRRRQDRSKSHSGTAKDYVPSPGLGHVAFLVHQSMNTTDWKVTDPDGMRGLLATLRLRTETGWIRVHNLHNRLKLLQTRRLVQCMKESDILLGDFNCHHPSWGGLGTRSDSDGNVVDDLARQKGMKCLNIPGTFSFLFFSVALFDITSNRVRPFMDFD